MQRRRLAWVFALGLMATGGLLAHTLAYRLVPAHPGESHLAMHGYEAHWRICLAISLTVAAIGLAGVALERSRGLVPTRLPLWLFSVLPLLGFVFQEHVERALATGAFSTSIAAEPAFLIGLLLQVPFALVAYVVARALLAVATALAERFGGAPRPRLATTRPCWIPGDAPGPPRLTALALGHGQRAPPAPAL
jgi:hypothetical protein